MSKQNKNNSGWDAETGWDRSYFNERMKRIGVTEENNKVLVYDPAAESPAPSEYMMQIFEPMGEDIKINYCDIEGNRIVYQTDGKTPQPRYWFQKRLRHPKGDNKYWQPSGRGTRPFFPPSLIGKYYAAEKIERLILTEGAFKAFMGGLHGLDIVGLTSITHYGNGKGGLHDDIVKLIKKCRVEYIIILWDGDCLNISKKDLLRRTDLTSRPKGFYGAAKAITKLIQRVPFSKKEGERPIVFFKHVKPQAFDEAPKGLDDMIEVAVQEKKVEAVIQDARRISKSGRYFFTLNIDNNISALNRYFRLHSAQEFYTLHADTIGDTEFVFHHDVVKWDDFSDKLVVTQPGWAKNTYWIGDEFFVDRVIPGANGRTRQLLKRNKSTLIDIHGDRFWKKLTFHDSFVNVPDHFNYQQVVQVEGKKYYNRYFPFVHEPIEGQWGSILRFLKHIFGEHEVKDRNDKVVCRGWELGLDYLQLLLTKPTQILPVLCLYSPENNTGKSLFGKLQRFMFGDNYIQLSNSDFQSEFNEQFADKLLAVCEETLLERKKEAEKIKALSTSDRITVNPKGQKQYSIDFFTKFQFYSNNMRMVHVTQHDERFWILRVPVPKTDDPDLLSKMKKEVPAFVHHLKHRKLATKRESRMHFHYSLLRTEAFFDAVKVNEPTHATELRDAVTEMFISNPHLPKIELPLDGIREHLIKSNNNLSTGWLREILKDYIEVEQMMGKDGKAKLKRGTLRKYEFDHGTQRYVLRSHRWRGRPYIFPREQFVKDDDYDYSEIEDDQDERHEPPTLDGKADQPFS